MTIKQDIVKWLRFSDKNGEYPMNLSVEYEEDVFELAVNSAELAFTFDTRSHHPNSNDSDELLLPLEYHADELEVGLSSVTGVDFIDDSIVLVDGTDQPAIIHILY